MATIGVQLDIDPVLRSLKRLGTDLAEKAITRSLNRTITGVRTAASRKVREELTLKAKDVTRELAVRRARRGELEAALDISLTGTGLIKFRARQTQRGVSVQVKKRGSRKRIAHGFITRKRSGRLGVFTRERGVARNPIRLRMSTSVGQFLSGERVLDELGEIAQERFTKELSSQVDFLLR